MFQMCTGIGQDMILGMCQQICGIWTLGGTQTPRAGGGLHTKQLQRLQGVLAAAKQVLLFFSVVKKAQWSRCTTTTTTNKQDDGLPIVHPVPQITEDSLPFVPQERVLNRTPEQIVGVVPASGPWRLPVDVVPSPATGSASKIVVAEQIVGIPVPQVMEAVVEVIPQERVQNRVAEANRGYSCASAHGGRRGSYTTGTRAESFPGADYGFSCASASWRPFVEVIPQERVQNRTLEQIEDFPVPQITENQLAVRTPGTRAESHA